LLDRELKDRNLDRGEPVSTDPPEFHQIFCKQVRMLRNSEHELHIVPIPTIQMFSLCEDSISTKHDTLETCFLAKSNYLVGIFKGVVAAPRVSTAVSQS
jgi:hypothetical protein